MRIALGLLVLAACGDEGRDRVFGATRWEVPVQGISNVEIDAQGDVIVGGWTNPASDEVDGYVRKLDRDTGADVWTVSLAGGYAWVPRVAVGADGTVAVCGMFQGSIDFGGTRLDAPTPETFVASYDALGALRWVRSLGPDVAGEPWRVVVRSDGSVVLSGWFVGAFGAVTSIDQDEYVVGFDAGGEMAWTYIEPRPGMQLGGDLEAAPDGDVVVAGEGDGPLVRLAPEGEPRWTLPLETGGRAITFAGDELVLVGREPADDALHLRRFDPDGADVGSFELWRSDLAGWSIATAPDGTIVLAGEFGSENPSGMTGATLVAFDDGGRVVESRSFTEPSRFHSLAIGSDGAMAFHDGGAVVVLDAPH